MRRAVSAGWFVEDQGNVGFKHSFQPFCNDVPRHEVVAQAYDCEVLHERRTDEGSAHGGRSHSRHNLDAYLLSFLRPQSQEGLKDRAGHTLDARVAARHKRNLFAACRTSQGQQ